MLFKSFFSFLFASRYSYLYVSISCLKLVSQRATFHQQVCFVSKCSTTDGPTLSLQSSPEEEPATPRWRQRQLEQQDRQRQRALQQRDGRSAHMAQSGRGGPHLRPSGPKPGRTAKPSTEDDVGDGGEEPQRSVGRQRRGRGRGRMINHRNR